MNFKDHIEHLKTFFTPSVKNVILLIRWLITAVFTGLLVGAVGTLFYYAMSFVTGCRTAHPILIYLLPFAGLLIIFLYRVITGHFRFQNRQRLLQKMFIQAPAYLRDIAVFHSEKGLIIFIYILIYHIHFGNSLRIFKFSFQILNSAYSMIESICIASVSP